MRLVEMLDEGAVVEAQLVEIESKRVYPRLVTESVLERFC